MNLSRDTSREALIRDISEGQYDLGKIKQILMIDLVEGQPTGGAYDVSEAIAKAVSEFSHRTNRELAPSAQAFLGSFGYDSHDPGYDDERGPAGPISAGWRHLQAAE
jgi:hypothetical protein